MLKDSQLKKERRNFLVLRSVLLKNAYFNSANPDLTKEVRLVELR